MKKTPSKAQNVKNGKTYGSDKKNFIKQEKRTEKAFIPNGCPLSIIMDYKANLAYLVT